MKGSDSTPLFDSVSSGIMGKKRRVRALAICVFRRDNHIFVAEGYDRIRKQTFYRPLGGGIEFGERAADTIKREVMEEIGAMVADLRYLGTLENLFVYEDEPGHEIVLVFDGAFVDSVINEDSYMVEGQDDNHILFTAMWKSLDYFRAGQASLYPDGLLSLLEGNYES